MTDEKDMNVLRDKIAQIATEHWVGDVYRDDTAGNLIVGLDGSFNAKMLREIADVLEGLDKPSDINELLSLAWLSGEGAVQRQTAPGPWRFEFNEAALKRFVEIVKEKAIEKHRLAALKRL